MLFARLLVSLPQSNNDAYVGGGPGVHVFIIGVVGCDPLRLFLLPPHSLLEVSLGQGLSAQEHWRWGQQEADTRQKNTLWAVPKFPPFLCTFNSHMLGGLSRCDICLREIQILPKV